MNSNVARVAVVVTTKNRAGQLAELLDALAAQTVDRSEYEVVVVDDGSTDGTAALLGEEAERDRFQLSVVSHQRSGGAAVGREAGWRASSAPLIAFTDDDCMPQPDWLEVGLAACAANPGTIVQGRTLPRPDELHKSGPFSRTISVTALDHAYQTTNIFYPREVLDLVDGFDTASYLGAVGGEDTDLALRALKAGSDSMYEERAVVFHAVNVLGPAGLLKVAGRWTAVLPYARHPELRTRDFVAGVFRKKTHLWLLMALIGASAPGRWRGVGALLALPYLRALRARSIQEGSSVAVWPFYALHDLIEIGATVRGGLKGGRFML